MSDEQFATGISLLFAYLLFRPVVAMVTTPAGGRGAVLSTGAVMSVLYLQDAVKLVVATFKIR